MATNDVYLFRNILLSVCWPWSGTRSATILAGRDIAPHTDGWLNSWNIEVANSGIELD